jgi:two-component system nitrogen regulation sensor histidine kinase NtrY
MAELKSEELPEETALALVAVRVVSIGDKSIFVAGGQKLDKTFLASLDPPEGMRVLLYRSLQPVFSEQALTGANGPAPDAKSFAPLIAQVIRQRKESTRVVGTENFQAVPRFGRDKELLAVQLIGSSRADMLKLENLIRQLGLAVGAIGVLLGLALAWWATARITRPVHELAAAAGEVAAGNWNAHVPVQSSDEIGELAAAFNQMTRHLTDQRERLVQSERVAAWRELARRLAHELKNPLFPLQITVENMQRARDQYPEQFDEVFREGAATLLAELTNLKTIINRFSDFSKMPPPERQPTNLNEILRGVMKLFEAQLAAQQVTARLELDEDLPKIDADPAQLHRALQNLVLNALDVMPSGGVLTLRTAHSHGSVRLEVSDTGSGLTKEECERLFTPYYTTKQHGTGLGLAIVQSVISDHGGRISVESEPGKGSTFRIELQDGTSPHH